MATRSQMRVDLDRTAVLATLEEQLKSFEAKQAAAVKHNTTEEARYKAEYKVWAKEVKTLVAKFDGEIMLGTTRYGYRNELSFEGLDFPKAPKAAARVETYTTHILNITRTIAKLKMVVGSTVPSTFEGLSQYI